MLQIIRLAAGDADSLKRAVTRSGKDPAFIRAAAIYYVENVLWADKGDHYRTLGLSASASQDDLAEHFRWLMWWLLPFLGRPAPESPFAENVLNAWLALRTPLLREHYDAAGSEGPMNINGAPDTQSRTNWRSLAVAGLVTAVLAVGLLFGSGELPLLAGITDLGDPAIGAVQTTDNEGAANTQ